MRRSRSRYREVGLAVERMLYSTPAVAAAAHSPVVAPRHGTVPASARSPDRAHEQPPHAHQLLLQIVDFFLQLRIGRIAQLREWSAAQVGLLLVATEKRNHQNYEQVRPNSNAQKKQQIQKQPTPTAL